MSSDGDPVSFRRICADDEPLLALWLAEPHVREWWGEPDREIELIREGESSGESQGYLGFVAARPVAYLQAWTPGAQADDEWQLCVPRTARGVDMFVGPPDCLGQGTGSRILRAFTEKLFDEGIPQLFIDPHVANPRAIRAYERAGFRRFALAGRNRDTVLMDLVHDQ